MRKYQPIWEALKKDNHCTVAAIKRFQARIIHAVINEKYYDAGYKVLCDVEDKKAKIEYVCEENRIRFFLRVTKGLGDL